MLEGRRRRARPNTTPRRGTQIGVIAGFETLLPGDV
jgi:hypothetical protein